MTNVLTTDKATQEKAIELLLCEIDNLLKLVDKEKRKGRLGLPRP